MKMNFAGEGEFVQGMMNNYMCEADDALQYSLHAVSNVEVQLYEVEFRLKPATVPQKIRKPIN